MLPNSNEQQTIKHVVLIGVIFLMAGLGALILFGEPTPLLVLGIVFTLSPFLAPSTQGVSNAL